MRKRGLSQVFVSAYALTVLAISEKFQSLLLVKSFKVYIQNISAVFISTIQFH